MSLKSDRLELGFSIRGRCGVMISNLMKQTISFEVTQACNEHGHRRANVIRLGPREPIQISDYVVLGAGLCFLYD